MEISEIHDLLHTDRKVYKTHLKELNCLLGGGIPEDSLTVVTSGVSVGKSMLAQNLFTSIYLQSSDINAIAFTLESSKYDFLKRVFSSVSATKQNEVFDAIKSKPDLEKTLEFLFNRLLLSTKSNVCYIRLIRIFLNIFALMAFRESILGIIPSAESEQAAIMIFPVSFDMILSDMRLLSIAHTVSASMVRPIVLTMCINISPSGTTTFDILIYPPPPRLLSTI